jgi:eukaryotic-like serine/threonine-protein kinase
MQASEISAESVLEELNRIVSSSLFANADRSRTLLKFVVEATVNQQADRLKEYTLGAEALGRGDGFDPRTDPIVRAEASRLRSRLERYYAGEGKGDPVEIVLPKGSYVPQFVERVTAGEAAAGIALAAEEVREERFRLSRLSLSRWVMVAALFVAVAIAVWGAVALMRAQSRPAARQVVEFLIPSPPGSIFAAPIARQPFAISPDGTRLAFAAFSRNGPSIWIRDFATLEPRAVAGTEGAWSVFWSPDSRSIFFPIQRTLKQANLETNSTRTVANLPYMAMYGAWRSKNEMLLYLGPTTFYELQMENGNLREIPGADMRWAQFLPDSDRFLHVKYDSAVGRYRAIATDYTTHESTTLMETDSRVQYAPPRSPGEPGYLLFLRGGSLLAQPFDAKSLKLMGNPMSLVQNVISFGPSASACFSVSSNGVLVYQTGYPLSELRWYDREGHVVSAARPAAFRGSVRFSRDGRHVAAGEWSPDNGGIDLWIFDQDGRESRRLTYPPYVHNRMAWSPDGSRIVVGASKTAGPKLTIIDTAGAGKDEPLKEALLAPAPADLQIPTDWSSDGRWIVFDTSLGEEEVEIWIADAKDGTAMPLLHGQFGQWGAAFSPDGKQLAFISEESGRPEVYVQGFEAMRTPRLVGERRQVSHNGGWIARWRQDGGELFYAGVDSQLYAVRMEHGAVASEPLALFQIPGNPQWGTATDFQFDVRGDGQRFVMTTTASSAPPPFTVIENWQDKFRR